MRLLFAGYLPRGGAWKQSDPSGPRDTSRRAINKTDNRADFIFTTRSFDSEAVLCTMELKNKLDCCYCDILYGLAIKAISQIVFDYY